MPHEMPQRLPETSLEQSKRIRFLYKDTSLPDQPILFETIRGSQSEADQQFEKSQGYHPITRATIICEAEDMETIEKAEFDEFVKNRLAPEGKTLTEYAREQEQAVYDDYLASLGLTETELRDKRILDVGADKGFFASYCAQQGINPNVESVDGGQLSYFDKKLQEAAWTDDTRQERQRRTKQALMQALPYQNESFDLVVILAAHPGRESEFRGALSVEEDVDRSYDEILRMLAPGGEARIAPFYAEADENDEFFGDWLKATKKKLEALSHVEGITVTLEPISEAGDKRIIIRRQKELRELEKKEE